MNSVIVFTFVHQAPARGNTSLPIQYGESKHLYLDHRAWFIRVDVRLPDSSLSGVLPYLLFLTRLRSLANCAPYVYIVCGLFCVVYTLNTEYFPLPNVDLTTVFLCALVHVRVWLPVISLHYVSVFPHVVATSWYFVYSYMSKTISKDTKDETKKESDPKNWRNIKGKTQATNKYSANRTKVKQRVKNRTPLPYVDWYWMILFF